MCIGEAMKHHPWKRQAIIVGLLLWLLLASCIAGSAKDTQQQSTNSVGRYLVYISGHSTLMGSSFNIHVTPFWFQSSQGWVSYGFEGTTLVIINGVPSVQDAVRIYMEGFKGLAPGSLHWATKSLVGRIRILGMCTTIEIH